MLSDEVELDLSALDCDNPVAFSPEELVDHASDLEKAPNGVHFGGREGQSR